MVLITWIIFSVLSSTVFADTMAAGCCGPRELSQVQTPCEDTCLQTATEENPHKHKRDSTSDHHHGQDEHGCSNDCSVCHSHTSQAFTPSTKLVYLAINRDLTRGQFMQPEPVFLSTPLRPPIS